MGLYMKICALQKVGLIYIHVLDNDCNFILWFVTCCRFVVTFAPPALELMQGENLNPDRVSGVNKLHRIRTVRIPGATNGN